MRVGRFITTLVLFAVALIAFTLTPVHAKGTKKDKTKVTATWVAPADGSTFVAPANIALTAHAEVKQNNREIVLVEWFQGATLIGSQTTPTSGNTASGTYQFNWNNVPPGTYSLTVAATNDKDDFDETLPVTITVVKANQTITGFNPTTPITYAPGVTFTLTATGGASGNPIVFASSTPSVCTVAGNTATVQTAGTCTLTADQAGNTNYNPAPQIVATVVIDKANQSITGFAPASPLTYTSGGTFALTATGGASGNAVTFASTTPTVCTVAGNTATIVSAGTCILTVDQAGNTNYNPAPQQTATVIIENANQTITGFNPTSPQTLAVGATFTLTATGGASTNPVTFASTTTSVCTTSGTNGATVTVVSTGSCNLTANQAGNGNYNAAPQQTASVTITVPPTEAQVYFIHADHLGTPRVITKATDNTKVWEWSNAEPFGDNAPNEDPNATGTAFKFNLRFPGQYFDQETGTSYNYFRDYDATTGRYVQSDPIGQLGGLNLYLYVLNDPLSYVDGDGLRPRPQSTGGNAAQRRFDRRNPRPEPPTPSPGGQNSLGDSAGYFNSDGEYVCLRWNCPANPDSCSTNDIRSFNDFIPAATDPAKPPKGCTCDEPRFRLQNSPGTKSLEDYLDAAGRGYKRFTR